MTDARGECLPLPPEGSQSDTDPGVRPAATYPESGHGLLLVQSLASRWGVEPYPPSGKTVWCEMGVGARPASGGQP